MMHSKSSDADDSPQDSRSAIGSSGNRHHAQHTHAGRSASAHDDHHGHDHAHSDKTVRGLTWTLVLITAYMLAEFIGGWWTGSLALMADAGHMFSDAAALAISLYAARLVRAPAGGQRTFGYHRAEVLAALANGATLFAVAGGIVWEAWERFTTPTPINAMGMLVIAVGGLLVNLVALAFLHRGHSHDMNAHGAWLHVVGDTLGSVAVIIGAIVVGLTNRLWVDPLISVIVSLLLLVSAWRLMMQAIRILMEHAPDDIEIAKIEAQIRDRHDVVDLHCLHVWTLGSGKHALSAHVVVRPDTDLVATLTSLQSDITRLFPIGHMTVQLEHPGMPCIGREPCVMGTCKGDVHR